MVEQVFAQPAGRGLTNRPKGVRVRVLGVDPGLTRCGIAVVEGTAARALTAVAVDVIRTPSASPLGDRLVLISAALDRWIEQFQPDAVAVERVFAQHNVRTVMGTAQVSALAILAAAKVGLPVALHTPSEVKAAVTGNGRADKAQVSTMVVRLLKLAETPTPADATDALALAMCHLWRGDATARIATALARSQGAVVAS